MTNHLWKGTLLKLAVSVLVSLLAFSYALTRKSIYVPVGEVRTQAWYSAYADNELDSARVLLETHLQKHPDELPALVYYAETLRRLNKNNEADLVANRVLSLDPRSSFALRIKGDVCNYQYNSQARYSREDSSVYYYRKSVQANPDDGSTWKVLWIAEMRRENPEQERAALRNLHRCGMFTRAAYAYARWLLNSLPDSAVLITNGDMDTYPLLVLQEVENLRQDVVVVNLSMLNLKWYYRYLCRNRGILTCLTGEDLDATEHQTKDGVFQNIAMQLVAGWIDIARQGRLGRPLCAAITVSDELLPSEFCRTRELRGPFYTLTGEPMMSGSNPEALEATLRPLDFKEFSGQFISDMETSPVMLKSKADRLLDANIMVVAIYAALGYRGKNQYEKALAITDWAKAYLEGVGNERSDYMQKLQMLRKELLTEMENMEKKE